MTTRPPAYALLIEEEPSDLETLAASLSAVGLLLEHVRSVDAGLGRLAAKTSWETVIVDAGALGPAGFRGLTGIHRAAGGAPVFIRGDDESLEVAAEAIAAGAQDYLVRGRCEGAMVARTVRLGVDRHRREQARHERMARFVRAATGGNDGLWDWNLRANTVSFTPRWFEMLGVGASTGPSAPEEWLDRMHPDDRAGLLAALRKHIGGLAPQFEHEYRIRHSDGRWLVVLCRGLAQRDRSGRVIGVAGTQMDVTRQKQVERQLYHDAFHDGLTGLPNRALFLDRLGTSLRQLDRRPGTGFAVLFLDLDRFKLVNDSLGHLAGDALLVHVADLLRRCLRPGDTVARLGGDEFAILVEDVPTVRHATRAAERIQAALAHPVQVAGHEVFPSASIGIAHSSGGAKCAEDLLRDADLAMYRSKKNGAVRHELYGEEFHEAALERLALETDLRLALARDELKIHYQPIVQLQSSRITGFEALLRWDCPKRGLVMPGHFVPVLEETGLILPVGEWVLREACGQMKLWESDGLGRLGLSVNLSARQFSQGDLAERLLGTVADVGFSSSRLTIEITESALLANPIAASNNLKKMRDRGVGIDIDDFGTGYSSLAYLKRYPVDRLKIDRSFVSGMLTSRSDMQIVQSIVGLASGLGVGVVAEGIETPEQLDSLRQLACEFGQGYLFSRPISGEAMERAASTSLVYC